MDLHSPVEAYVNFNGPRTKRRGNLVFPGKDLALVRVKMAWLKAGVPCLQTSALHRRWHQGHRCLHNLSAVRGRSQRPLSESLSSTNGSVNTSVKHFIFIRIAQLAPQHIPGSPHALSRSMFPNKPPERTFHLHFVWHTAQHFELLPLYPGAI